MSDIDFEELDKAMNSLLSQRSEVPKKSNEDNEHYEAQPEGSDSRNSSDDSSDSQPDVEQPKSSSNTEPVDRSSGSPKVIHRSSGRFMDVVHPSSDMRFVSPQPKTSLSKARRTGSIEPLSEDTEPVTKEDIFEDLVLDGHKVDDPTKPMDSPFLENIEVDKRPLGLKSTQEENLSDSGAEAEEQESSEFDFDQSENASQTNISNENSPFDAKETNAEQFSEDSSTTVDTPSSAEQSFDDFPKKSETNTPPELSAEVMALESMDIKGGPVANSTETKEEKAKPDVMPLREPAKKSPSISPGGDIAQNYKSSDVDAPEPSAIFDAVSDDPQPLRHPAKASKGWSAILWIVILLSVGVAGGVLVWYFLIK